MGEFWIWNTKKNNRGVLLVGELLTVKYCFGDIVDAQSATKVFWQDIERKFLVRERKKVKK